LALSHGTFQRLTYPKRQPKKGKRSSNTSSDRYWQSENVNIFGKRSAGKSCTILSVGKGVGDRASWTICSRGRGGKKWSLMPTRNLAKRNTLRGNGFWFNRRRKEKIKISHDALTRRLPPVARVGWGTKGEHERGVKSNGKMNTPAERPLKKFLNLWEEPVGDADTTRGTQTNFS